ncbi:MAG: hypoxanthine phosphoribosyltransferase [Eubacterium sp.]
MEDDLKKVLLSQEMIKEKVKEIGKCLSKDYAHKNPVVICILKGSVIFFSDLIREMKIPLEIDFLKASSYGCGTKSSGNVQMKDDLSAEITNRHVLLIEDIVDSGNTLKFFLDFFRKTGALSVKCCTLLDKPERREVEINVDYTCFEIPDEFVVGYGLDYAHKFRNLPYIGVLDESNCC